MAESPIGARFVCSQCGAVAAQRSGRGRRFTKCEPCRTPATRPMAEIIAASPCNQDHTCEGCRKTFRPKRTDRARFCSRECAFATKTALARGPRPYEPKPLRTVDCAECGSPFETRAPARYCGDPCRAEVANRKALDRARQNDTVNRTPRLCGECGVRFTPAYGTKLREYCSAACGRRSGKRTGRLKGKARKRSATVEAVNPTRVFERDGWRCHLCGGLTAKTKRGTYHPKAPELDHIVPLSKGGEHSYRNTACAHRACNAAKSDSIIGQPSLLAA